MDAHTLEILEYHELLGVIAEYAQSGPGRRRILGLRPFSAVEEALRRHALYDDLMFALDEAIQLPEVRFDDLGGVFRRLEPKAAVVDGTELLGVRRVLLTVGDVRRAFRGEALRQRRSLCEVSEALEPCEECCEALVRALDEDGGIQDSASEELQRLRRQIERVERDVERRLERILRSDDLQPSLQEHFVTTRNGRYVIPVKRGMRSRIRGIVHDHSDSGQTVFVEPDVLLPLGNELADLRLDERDECRRILLRLCDMLRARLPGLRKNHTVLSRLDQAMAVARWGVEFDCVLPRFGNAMDVRAGRHPLLERQFRAEEPPRQVVPLNLRLDPRLGVLAITGSNSGGKTVALKCIGLLSLIAQSGLPAPVQQDSCFEFFRSVFADIGDEQSLSQNLSTFTGHLTRIRSALHELPAKSRRATVRSLVLLDELGAGTDPLEGGALACALIQELVQRPVLTVLTTHLGVVKNVVQDDPNMINAAVRFNCETLQPEYVLEVGHPGASHAFSIARRIGLPESIVDRAEGLLDSDQLHLESLLARLEEDQRKIAEQEDASRQAMSAARKERDELHGELDRMRRERRKVMREAYQQAAATVDATRREMDRIIREMRSQAQSREVEALARAAREQVKRSEKKIERKLRKTTPRPPQPLAPTEVREGMQVWVEKLQANGVVRGARDDRSKLTVEVGHVRFNVAAGDVSAAREGEPQAEKPGIPVSRPRVETRVASELNLVGKRVHEALPLLEAFVSRAALANVPEVRVIHGFGTGRLQRAVHEFLHGSQQIADYRLGEEGKDPGGSGCTVVTFPE